MRILTHTLVTVLLLLGFSPAAFSQSKPAKKGASKKARKFIRVPRLRRKPVRRKKRRRARTKKLTLSPQQQLHHWYKLCKGKKGRRIRKGLKLRGSSCKKAYMVQLCRLNSKGTKCLRWRARVKRKFQYREYRNCRRIKSKWQCWKEYRRNRCNLRSREYSSKWRKLCKRWKRSVSNSCARFFKRTRLKSFKHVEVPDYCKCSVPTRPGASSPYNTWCGRGFYCHRISPDSSQPRYASGICRPTPRKRGQPKLALICNEQSSQLGCEGAGIVCNTQGVERSAICHVVSTDPVAYRRFQGMDGLDQMALAYRNLLRKYQNAIALAWRRGKQNRKLKTQVASLKKQVVQKGKALEQKAKALKKAQEKLKRVKAELKAKKEFADKLQQKIDEAIGAGDTANQSTQKALRLLAKTKRRIKKLERELKRIRPVARVARKYVRKYYGLKRKSHWIAPKGYVGGLCDFNGCSLAGGGGMSFGHQIHRISHNTHLFLAWDLGYIGVNNAHGALFPIGVAIGTPLRSSIGYMLAAKLDASISNVLGNWRPFIGGNVEIALKFQHKNFIFMLGATAGYSLGHFRWSITFTIGGVVNHQPDAHDDPNDDHPNHKPHKHPHPHPNS